jgi:hypothetical protein
MNSKSFINKIMNFLKKDRKCQTLKINFEYILHEKDKALAPIICNDDLESIEKSSYNLEILSSAFNSSNFDN